VLSEEGPDRALSVDHSETRVRREALRAARAPRDDAGDSDGGG
jgi:hypothetical protein